MRGSDLCPDWAILMDLWSSRSLGRPYPSRSDFVAEDFAPWFGDLGLLDVTDDVPPRFRVRLAGTRITAMEGRESTGRHLDEIVPAPFACAVLDPLRACVEAGRPVLDVVAVDGDAAVSRIRRLILPLAAGDGRDAGVGLLLCAVRADARATSSPKPRPSHIYDVLACHGHSQTFTVLDRPGARW
jgi:hypothetical protein